MTSRTASCDNVLQLVKSPQIPIYFLDTMLHYYIAKITKNAIYLDTIYYISWDLFYAVRFHVLLKMN